MSIVSIASKSSITCVIDQASILLPNALFPTVQSRPVDTRRTVLILIEVVVLLVPRVDHVSLSERAWVVAQGTRFVSLIYLIPISTGSHFPWRAVAEIIRFFVVILFGFLLHYNLVAARCYPILKIGHGFSRIPLSGLCWVVDHFCVVVG